MLPAEVIAHVADIVIGLFAVVIFLMVNVISGAKNNVVVNVSSVYVRSDNIEEYLPSKSLSASSTPIWWASL